jgi:hypothetical protein
MGFLRRLRGRAVEPVPEWAAFLSPRDYRTFIERVERHLRRRGSPWAIKGDVVETDLGDQVRILALANIAERTRGRDPGWIPSIVDDFFKAMDEAPDITSIPFADARGLLRTSLYNVKGIDGKPNPSFRPFGSSLYEALVIDGTTVVESVTVDQLASWPIDLDEAFSIARANVLAEEVRPVQTVEAPNDTSFQLQLGNSHFVASRVVGLRGTPGSPDDDFVVAMPNHHSLLWREVAGAGLSDAMAGMARMTEIMFENGLGLISPDLFRWRAGELLDIDSLG